MAETVLWYVHDRGSGHLHRASAVTALLDSPVVVACGPGVHAKARHALSVPVRALPSDVPATAEPTVGPWHHAPTSPEVRARALALADVVRAHHCTTAVVDVSMEVVTLARLMGLRVVALRQSGRRRDAAHCIGFASADIVWVPQCRALEPIDLPIDGRWRFTGAFSRFDSLAPPLPARGRAQRLVVLLIGNGGHGLNVERWSQARPPDGWRVVVAGSADQAAAGSPGRAPAGAVDVVGHVDPVFPLLADADVVIASAGWSAVADVVAASARLVLVPEDRPFDEQHVRARALSAAGLALFRDRWPTPQQLPAVLEEAMQLEPCRWHDHYDRRGGQRAAALVDELHAS